MVAENIVYCEPMNLVKANWFNYVERDRFMDSVPCSINRNIGGHISTIADFLKKFFNTINQCEVVSHLFALSDL